MLRFRWRPGIFSCLITSTLKACLPSLAVFCVTTGPALAEMMRIVAEGRDDYRDHCAACHGESGVGDGKLAGSLVVPPSDLTRLATNNRGVFPFSRVYELILGDTPVTGHETFQMPHFSERFRRDDAKPGYLPGYVRGLFLTHYLQTIQDK